MGSGGLIRQPQDDVPDTGITNLELFQEDVTHRALFGSHHVLPCLGVLSAVPVTTRPGSQGDGNKGMPQKWAEGFNKSPLLVRCSKPAAEEPAPTEPSGDEIYGSTQNASWRGHRGDVILAARRHPGLGEAGKQGGGWEGRARE